MRDFDLYQVPGSLRHQQHAGRCGVGRRRTLLSIALILTALAVVPAQAQFVQSAKLADGISTEVEKLLKLSAERTLNESDIDTLFRAAVKEYGNVDPLLMWLAETQGGHTDARSRTLGEVEAHVAARTGDLKRSSRMVQRLLRDEKFAKERTDLRMWDARLLDALGEVDDAKKKYEALSKEELPKELQQKVRLRIALMGLLGTGKSDAKRLIELAGKSKDIVFKNRAANVLAVQNQYKEAVKIFEVQGEGTERFRSASRVCEWAIRAKDRKKAIESAWDAVKSSKIKRDRRYALALLVESYRLKEEKKGLEALVKEFEKRSKDEKEPLNDEMRAVWVTLLRELERYDDAIKLFREGVAGGAGFTIEMRRELLEMQGEAGKTDAMIQSYRKLIDAEPDEDVWRGGLTRILLEQGRDKEARALWTDHIQTLNNGERLLLSAQTLADLGLDELASATVEQMVKQNVNAGQGLLFISDLYQRRGKLDDSEAVLNRLNDNAEAGDVVRFELAAAFERVGRQDKAVEVIEGIRASREEVATDLEMRLAWLYSETGDEEKALGQWLALWKETKSVARRRYVEDRLMTVASRLGTLGDIAVDLEVKLMDGKADDREAGLLTRIYSRVNDSVAASEVLEEYMTQAGKQEVERLQEKARIYQVCNDYWNYEKVIEQLIETDPEGETDYLRQLALSMLERGKAQEARAVLMKLRTAEGAKDNIGGEFEAGVLSLVGMKKEAADAYRKGIAAYPDRIESYLLLANLLKDLGQTERAVGMFQYLAETAEKDDLFTIAIDGVLNMEANRRVMQWARRITLERLAARDDKNYLYQLLSDLSEEVRDKNGQIRALENSLAVSGTRRQAILRECMDLSSRIRGGVFYSTASRGPTNAGNKPFFAFGRRLIGLGELMPPQVFLDLGQAFLDDGDVNSAERTFSLARNQADERGYERDVAKIFEKAGRKKESLERYDRLLRTNPSDVALIARVAKLNEQEGKDDVASKFYRRGFDLLLAQTPLTTLEEKDETQTGFYWARNQDAYDKYADELLRGVLITVPDDDIEPFLADEQRLLQDDLQALDDKAADGRTAKVLSDSPRIQKRSKALRRLFFAFDRLDLLRDMDVSLVERFKEDAKLATTFARFRVSRGEYSSAREFLDKVKATDDVKKVFADSLGYKIKSEGQAVGKLEPKEMWRQLLPHWMSGDKAAALKVLRRLDTTKITGSSPGQTVTYVYTGGQPTYTQQWASDVFILTQLALTLGDDGLALRFARSRVQNAYVSTGPIYGDPGITLLKAFKGQLPTESFDSLARFALSSFKEDKRNGLAYLWLVSELKDESLSDDQLLAKIEELKIGLDYYRFTFDQAVEIFPKSILAAAIQQLIDNSDQKMVGRPLAGVPFTHKKPLDAEMQKIITDGIAESIPLAMKDNYLSYITGMLPNRYARPGVELPPILANKSNADCAMKILDLFSAQEVRDSSEETANRAIGVKVLVLRQIGKTEEAIKLALETYDPKRNITDYYERYTWDQVKRDIFPLAPDKFLALTLKSDEKKDGDKVAVEMTDKRLAFVRSLGDESAIRAEYDLAWKNHPKQTKYTRAYRSWEQRAGRTMRVLSIDKRLMAQARRKMETPKDAKDAKSKARSQASKISSMQRQLASLWFSVGHPVNGLENWRFQDDADILRFKQEKARREKTAKAAKAGGDKKTAPAKPATPATPPAKAAAPAAPTTSIAATRTLILPGGASVPMVAIRSVATASQRPSTSSSTTKKPSNRPKNVTDLKKAYEAKKSDEASAILRELWRTYPPVEASPYGGSLYRNPSRLNNLRWPTTSTPKPKKELTEEEKKKAAEEAKKKAEEAKQKAEEARRKAEQTKRARLRGGLVLLDKPPVVRKPRKVPETIWSRLAEEDFAQEEMRRIIRSREPSELKSINEIVKAMLKADRKRSGDQAVFDSLLSGIRNGRAGKIRTAQLIAMLEENEKLLGENADKVIESLSRSLDLDQASVALQLASLCVKSGQKKRGMSLFVHYASRASDRDIYGSELNISFATLLTQAKEVFEGEELFELVEQMFDVTPVKSDVTVNAVLEMRHKQLEPKLAAERTRSFFSVLDSDPIGRRISPSVWGARIFAEAGDLDLATKCLRSAILRNNSSEQPQIGPVVYERKLSRIDYLRLFPKDHERFGNYTGWLAAASTEIAKLHKAGTLPDRNGFEMMLILAHRQCETDQQAAAKTSLQSIEGLMTTRDKQMQLLSIDVAREAGLTSEALALERQLYNSGTLSYVRFGDLLADTAAVDGAEKAKSLFSDLVENCLDKDLLVSAEGIADPDRLGSVRDATTAATAEYEARKKAATERRKQRSEWSKADAAKRKAAAEAKKKADAEKAKKAGKAGAKPKAKTVPAAALTPAKPKPKP